MKKGKLLRIGLMAALVITLLVSCQNEISDNSVGDAMISFAPSVSKALNEKGESNDMVSKEVNDYYWKYYCSTTAPVRNADNTYDDLDWKPFTSGLADSKKGLGTILNLVKGENYYFGLRGFGGDGTMDLGDLVWEGFHYSSQPATEEAGVSMLESVKLTSKTQLITIDVYNAGVGRLFFDFFAPAVNGFCVGESASANNFKIGNATQYDYFTYTLSSLDGTFTTTATDLKVNIEGTESTTENYGYYNVDEDRFYYNDLLTGSTGTEYEAGTYLMTIWQMSFDKDKTDSENPAGMYKAVSQRKQVLIVNIVPGVNTVVSGSLDSTALETFDFEGNYAFKVIFHQGDTDEVDALATNVFHLDSGYEAQVNNNWRVPVVDGEGVQIRWLPIETATTQEELIAELKKVKLYVNGEELVKSDSGYTLDLAQFFVEGYTQFYYRASTKPVYVNNLSLKVVQAENQTYLAVDAYGKFGNDYMIDIVYNDESKSYTIVGIQKNSATSTASFETEDLDEGDPAKSLVVMTTQTNITVTGGSISVSDANTFVNSVTADNTQYRNASDYNKTVDITLSVAEIESASSVKSYDISLNGTFTAIGKDNAADNFTKTAEIKSLSDYLTVQIQLEAGLESVTAYHSGYEMVAVDNVASPGTSDKVQVIDSTNVYLGFYSYDKTSGILTIKTKGFSTFTIKLGDYVAKVNDRGYTSLEAAFAGAAKNETIKLQKDAVINSCIAVDKVLTLDLNGKTITPVSTGFTTGTDIKTTDSMFVVKYGGKLTIRDTAGDGKISTNGATGINAAIKMTEDGDTYVSDNAILVVNGGIIEAYKYGIVGNAYRNNTEITINAGEITGLESSGNIVNSYGIYHPQDGTLTINGGTITGYAAAVEVLGGDLKVNGGTFTATAKSYSASGSNVSGAAVVVANVSDKEISAILSDGTFTGVKAFSETKGGTSAKVTLEISGGTFDGDLAVADSSKFIIEGLFTVDPTSYVSTNSYVLKDYPSSGKWTVSRRII